MRTVLVGAGAYGSALKLSKPSTFTGPVSSSDGTSLGAAGSDGPDMVGISSKLIVRDVHGFQIGDASDLRVDE
jgi:hypothetical protein